MRPMLAHIYDPKRFAPCWVQPKFDGIRALYQAGHFQSRDELPMSDTVLKHLIEPLREMFPDERIILDGELYVHGWPLGRINGAVTPVRQQPNEDTAQVEYYVFDRVDFHKPFIERFMSVQDTIKNLGGSKKINIATTMWAPTPDKADSFYAMCVNEGFEGIMYRLGHCVYTTPNQATAQICIDSNVSTTIIPIGRARWLSDKNNRTWHLLKRKDFQDDEFTCVDFNLTEGAKGETGFQLTCQTREGKRFNVGSGLTDSERDHYAIMSPVGRFVKVKFRCYTADGIPFNPTVITVL